MRQESWQKVLLIHFILIFSHFSWSMGQDGGWGSPGSEVDSNGFPVTTADPIQYLGIAANHKEFKRLGQYNIEPHITVSGLAFGGTFAVMVSFIFSSFIKGVGVFAGKPFGFGPILLSNPAGVMDFSAYTRFVKTSAAKGLIDNPANLARNHQGVYVYHGMLDPTPGYFSKMVAMQFQKFGVTKIKSKIKKVPSGNCIPYKQHTINEKLKPEIFRNCFLPYEGVCACGYSGVTDMFSVFFSGRFNAPNLDASPTGELYRFDQQEFLPGWDSHAYSWHDYGFIYVPTRCEPETGIVCKLHIAFHKCLQSYLSLGVFIAVPDFVEITGYKQNADLNDIIVIFPQLRLNIMNISIACFDSYGYTSGFNNKFSTKYGAHPSAIKKIYQRVLTGN